MNIDVIALATAIIAPTLSYLGIRHQSKMEIKKLKEQQLTAIENIKTEFDKIAETYEKTKQTDITYDLFLKFVNEPQALQNLENNMNKYNKLFNQGNIKHPALKNKKR